MTALPKIYNPPDLAKRLGSQTWLFRSRMLRDMQADRSGYSATLTFLICVYSSNSSADSSRPIPDCL
jgi:hypothetical protein